MFERICVSPTDPKLHHFDLGLLAESLVFYREVYIILDAASLQGLLQQIGPDIFLELISNEYLHIRYIDKLLGAYTKHKGTPSVLYDIGTITTEGLNLDVAARDAFISVTGKSGRGRRLATKFCRHVQPIDYPAEIIKDISRDMQEGVYIEEYIRRRINSCHTSDVPNMDHLMFRFSQIPGQGFQLKSNLNLREFRAGINTAGLDDPASILAHYGKTVGDMSLWAQLNSEATVSPWQSDVLSSRVDKLLERQITAATHISAFQDFVFDDARAIREVVNQGGREFKELLPVIQKARGFSDWLSAKPPNADLLKAYHKEVTSGTWIEKLPVKIARWLLFTGAGAAIDFMGGGGIGTAGGVGLSALDFFFLDKIIKGWKPNQFVEGPLRRFVEYQKP